MLLQDPWAVQPRGALGSVTELGALDSAKLTRAQVKALPLEELRRRVQVARAHFDATQNAYEIDRIRMRRIGKEPSPVLFRQYWEADEVHDKLASILSFREGEQGFCRPRGSV